MSYSSTESNLIFFFVLWINECKLDILDLSCLYEGVFISLSSSFTFICMDEPRWLSHMNEERSRKGLPYYEGGRTKGN